MKRKPTSRGEILNEEFLKPLGLTQKELADHLECDYKVVNRIVNEWASVIPIAVNNFLFELRESCRQIDERKWHSIKPIQCHLRSSIFGALTR